MGFPDPTATALFSMCAMGIKKLLGQTRIRKKPLTFGMVKAVVETCKRSASLINDRTSLYFIIGFAGFFRYNEMSQMKASDIQLLVTEGVKMLKIYIPRNKTDQLRTGREVLLVSTEDSYCPVKFFSNFQATYPQITGDAFLFQKVKYQKCSKSWQFTGAPLTYDMTNKFVKRALEAVGEKPEFFATHSLRAGGVTAAAQAGIAGRLLQAHGGWATTSAMDRYVENSVPERLSVSKAILHD